MRGLTEYTNAIMRLTGQKTRRFSRDEKGVTAIEFALIAVPFFGITFAIFETFLTFLNQQTLEQKTAEASRQLMVGNVAIKSAADFKEFFCPTTSAPTSAKLPSNFDCKKLIIDVRAPTSFSNANTGNDVTASSQSQFTLAPPGGVNVVRIIYPMPVYLPLLVAPSIGSTKVITTGLTQTNDGLAHNLMGISVFRTEPE